MKVLLVILACAVQADRSGLPVRPARERLDLLAPRLTADSPVGAFRLEAMRYSRLARLDQLLALTGAQRDELLRTMRRDVNRSFDVLIADKMGPLLPPPHLQEHLTPEQVRVLDRWQQEGALAWHLRKAADGTDRIDADARDAALLLAARVAAEAECSPKQRRRLELAARGLVPRFRNRFVAVYRALGQRQPALTDESLLMDRTLVPLLSELPLWRRTLANTLNRDQLSRLQQEDSRRLEFCQRANVWAAAADLQHAFHLGIRQTEQLRQALSSHCRQTRPVFPLRESSNPVLRLEPAEIRAIFSEADTAELQQAIRLAVRSYAARSAEPALRADLP